MGSQGDSVPAATGFEGLCHRALKPPQPHHQPSLCTNMDKSPRASQQEVGMARAHRDTEQQQCLQHNSRNQCQRPHCHTSHDPVHTHTTPLKSVFYLSDCMMLLLALTTTAAFINLAGIIATLQGSPQIQKTLLIHHQRSYEAPSCTQPPLC